MGKSDQKLNHYSGSVLFVILLPTEVRRVLGVGSIPVAILPCGPDMKIIAL